MPFIETADRTSLLVADWGSGPPVVFTHAWGLRSDQWNYQVPALVEAGLRCVLYDRRGHGRNGLITRRDHANTYDLTPMGWHSPSSTPRSTTGSWPRCSPPGSPRHRQPCTAHSPPSQHRIDNRLAAARLPMAA